MDYQFLSYNVVHFLSFHSNFTIKHRKNINTRIPRNFDVIENVYYIYNVPIYA